MSCVGARCALRRRRQRRPMRNSRRRNAASLELRRHEQEEVLCLKKELERLRAQHHSAESDVQDAESRWRNVRDRAAQAQLQYVEVQAENSELSEILAAEGCSSQDEVIGSPMSVTTPMANSASQLESPSLCLLLKMKLGLALAHCRDVESENSALIGQLLSRPFFDGDDGRCARLPIGRAEALTSAINELEVLSARLNHIGCNSPVGSAEESEEIHEWSDGHGTLMRELRCEYRLAVTQVDEKQRANDYRQRELKFFSEARTNHVELGDETTQELAAAREETSRVSSILELLVHDTRRLRSISSAAQGSTPARDREDQGVQDVEDLEQQLRQLRSESEAAATEVAEAEELKVQHEASSELNYEMAVETRAIQNAFAAHLPPLPKHVRHGQQSKPRKDSEQLPEHSAGDDGGTNSKVNHFNLPVMLPRLPFKAGSPKGQQQETPELLTALGDLKLRSDEAFELAEVRVQNDQLKEEIAAAREYVEQQVIQREIAEVRSRLGTVHTPLSDVASSIGRESSYGCSHVHADTVDQMPSVVTSAVNTSGGLSDMTQFDLRPLTTRMETAPSGCMALTNDDTILLTGMPNGTALVSRRHLPMMPCLTKTVPWSSSCDVAPVAQEAQIKIPKKHARLLK